MNFDFSDDQKLLADQVQRYLDDHCNNTVARAVLDGEQAYAQDVWAGLAEMGLLGTAIGEEYGGTGAGYLELCLVAQQIGAHIAPVPFGGTVYQVAEALLASDDEDSKTRWLPKIASGEVKGALAVVENLGADTPRTPACEVIDGKLRGSKLAVTDGALADVYVVLAAAQGQPGLYLVDAQTAVEATTVESVDLTKNVANVAFDDAPAHLLSSDGLAALAALEDRAAVLYAFEQLGGAQSALDMAVAYAKERFAFGRAIGSFQAIKHMLADMYVSLKLAESNCYYAAWALANDAADLPLAAATARVAATQAFQLCARDNIQVHGGMGFTWEFDCHMYYRRANLLAMELGGLSKWEQRLVASLPLQASA
ncbi:MAG: acyl-CoA dehydrogenase family protein [Pseudomonadota bacterium]